MTTKWQANLFVAGRWRRMGLVLGCGAALLVYSPFGDTRLAAQENWPEDPLPLPADPKDAANTIAKFVEDLASVESIVVVGEDRETGERRRTAFATDEVKARLSAFEIDSDLLVVPEGDDGRWTDQYGSIAIFFDTSPDTLLLCGNDHGGSHRNCKKF